MRQRRLFWITSVMLVVTMLMLSLGPFFYISEHINHKCTESSSCVTCIQIEHAKHLVRQVSTFFIPCILSLCIVLQLCELRRKQKGQCPVTTLIHWKVRLDC